MSILVSDSSVLIDLERGGLLEVAFASGFTMVVPDHLYDNELRDSNGPYLVGLGLSVIELTPDEMQLAQEVLNLNSELSLEDCFALACAMRDDHVLLVGDAALRTEAERRHVVNKGLLWLLDQMLNLGKANQSTLCEGLTKISQHHRCRLPKGEVERRLRAWCP